MRFTAKDWKASAGYAGLVLALFFTVGAAWQQSEDLPNGRQVVDRFIEAIGGKDAILAQGAQHAKGRVEVPAQGIVGDLDVYSAPPNKNYTYVSFSGIGSIRAGYNGEVGWMIHPAMGPMVLEGRMLEQTRHQSDATAPLHPETLIASLETVEKIDFEGQTCYKVKVTTRWDEEYFEYFNVESGLLVGVERSQASPMGPMPATTVVSDYQEFAGVLSPRKTVQRVMGMEEIITVLDLSNIEPADTLFALPEEIKALMAPAKP